ncbi:hypothetical protein [uncultured Paludibaculum sp.]|uniref:hypothetical protein n=1 Tax=uncultured Paludibaculum sp. TaxID=1765020 RepID=UPI002AAB57A2|nr:hypothetical protein [uncultured Paludibaculum sp.]
MKRETQFGTGAPMATLAVLALILSGMGALSPLRALPATAHRFVCYMTALDQSGQHLSLWDKVTYSLVLSGPNPKQANAANARI